MTEEKTTEVLMVIKGFHANNKAREVVLYGDEITVVEGVIQGIREFERYLCEEDDRRIKVKREPNQGEAVFFHALAERQARAHRRLAPAPQPVLS